MKAKIGATEEAGPPVKELRNSGKYGYCQEGGMNEFESEQVSVCCAILRF